MNSCRYPQHLAAARVRAVRRRFLTLSGIPENAFAKWVIRVYTADRTTSAMLDSASA